MSQTLPQFLCSARWLSRLCPAVTADPSTRRQWAASQALCISLEALQSWYVFLLRDMILLTLAIIQIIAYFVDTKNSMVWDREHAEVVQWLGIAPTSKIQWILYKSKWQPQVVLTTRIFSGEALNQFLTNKMKDFRNFVLHNCILNFDAEQVYLKSKFPISRIRKLLQSCVCTNP